MTAVRETAGGGVSTRALRLADSNQRKHGNPAPDLPDEIRAGWGEAS